MHAWERRLAHVDTNRVALPFDWGLEWLGRNSASPNPAGELSTWVAEQLTQSDQLYATPATDDYELRGDVLRFPSAVETPHRMNNTVTARVFPARSKALAKPKRAIVVLPQWNYPAEGHVGLCQLFARLGITAVRVSLPYHDERRPPELERAEYLLSANIGRTLQANRQAVVDTRRAVGWLAREGYERIGIMGTSLGSCIAALTMSHEPRIVAGAFNLVSPYFADVVWRGLTTQHLRAALEGHVTLDALREYWLPISPWPFIERLRGRDVLLVYALYDLSFPVDLSRDVIREFRRRQVPHEAAALPCGHYTTGSAPFKYLDAYYLARFFAKRL
jgi:dienelactone hydrolase